MERFEIYVPKANGQPPERDIIEEFMSLIPYGNENAIGRKLLVQKCMTYDLIGRKLKDPDRAMRELLKKAKKDYAICNIGKGYFRPTDKDGPYIDHFIAVRQKHGESSSDDLGPVLKIQADIHSGRMAE